MDEARGTMVPMWGWVIAVVIVAAGLYALHRLALWAASRGWIFYGDSQRPAGTTSRAVSGVDVIFRPEVEHHLEEMEAQEILREDDDSGVPPVIDLD